MYLCYHNHKENIFDCDSSKSNFWNFVLKLKYVSVERIYLNQFENKTGVEYEIQVTIEKYLVDVERQRKII